MIKNIIRKYHLKNMCYHIRAVDALGFQGAILFSGHAGPHQLDVPVVIGGIVPDEDRPAMANAGVAGVLGPGATAEEVVACVQAAADARG